MFNLMSNGKIKFTFGVSGLSLLLLNSLCDFQFDHFCPLVSIFKQFKENTKFF